MENATGGCEGKPQQPKGLGGIGGVWRVLADKPPGSKRLVTQKRFSGENGVQKVICARYGPFIRVTRLIVTVQGFNHMSDSEIGVFWFNIFHIVI